jgi:TonB family protein
MIATDDGAQIVEAPVGSLANAGGNLVAEGALMFVIASMLTAMLWHEPTPQPQPPMPAATSTPEVILTHPVWVQLPRAGDLYPEKAQRMGVEGFAEMRCRVLANGHLDECQLKAESPTGYDLGATLMRSARGFVLTPAQRPAGSDVVLVDVPFKWKMARH